MTDSTMPATLKRVPTGISGLDVVLKGGLLTGGIYLVSGEAGTGKTILANQVCFYHVQNGGRAVYVTLMAETHSHLFSLMGTLSFFDQKRIGDTLHYYAGYSVIDSEYTAGRFAFLRSIIREQRASLIVIDTLLTAEMLTPLVEFRKFMHELSAYLETNRCTALLLTHPDEATLEHVKNTMADGVLRLTNEQIGRRTIREMQMIKFRGSAYLEGRHTLDISQNGVRVYPRAESLFGSIRQFPLSERSSITFDVESLDQMLHDGIKSGSTTMVMGVPGVGKTVLGLHFLVAGARRGEHGVYYGFNETPLILVHKAEQIGLDFNQYVQNGLIDVLWQAPLEGVLDIMASNLLKVVEQSGARRLFIDGLTGLVKAADFPARIDSFVIALTNALRDRGVTLMISAEMSNQFGPVVEIPTEGMAITMDNMIFLRFVELHSQLYRLISILKMRESDYDSSIREFKITAHGIEVAQTFQSAQAILTGVAIPLTRADKAVND